MPGQPSDPALDGWILGFDIGGTKTSIVAGSRDGAILGREELASEAHLGFGHMWTRMTTAGDRMVGRRGCPAAIGVSVGGPVDHDLGMVMSPPNLPGWDRIPLAHLLTERFGVPAFVEHDAKAGLLAEWYFGAARGAVDAIFLTLGTGLGCGVLAGGQLLRGTSNRAGEVGHWRMAPRGPRAYGKPGSWEAFSSGTGLSRLAHHLYPGRWTTGIAARDLVDLARAGDMDARRVVTRSATWLGRGIAQLVDLLDPEVAVLGALAWRAADLYLPIVRRTVAKETLGGGAACRIATAELGEQLGDIAAITAAIHHGGLEGTGTARRRGPR